MRVESAEPALVGSVFGWSTGTTFGRKCSASDSTDNGTVSTDESRGQRTQNKMYVSSYRLIEITDS